LRGEVNRKKWSGKSCVAISAGRSQNIPREVGRDLDFPVAFMS
jgi:hypothetical protein